MNLKEYEKKDKYLDFARELWNMKVTIIPIVIGGARGVMVVVAGCGHDDTSSNPGRS